MENCIIRKFVRSIGYATVIPVGQAARNRGTRAGRTISSLLVIELVKASFTIGPSLRKKANHISVKAETTDTTRSRVCNVSV